MVIKGFARRWPARKPINRSTTSMRMQPHVFPLHLSYSSLRYALTLALSFSACHSVAAVKCSVNCWGVSGPCLPRSNTVSLKRSVS